MVGGIKVRMTLKANGNFLRIYHRNLKGTKTTFCHIYMCLLQRPIFPFLEIDNICVYDNKYHHGLTLSLDIVTLSLDNFWYSEYSDISSLKKSTSESWRCCKDNDSVFWMGNRHRNQKTK